MTMFGTKAVIGLTLAATAMTVAAPADAQRYRGDRGDYRGDYRGDHRGHRDRDGTGAAIVAGIAGLAIGAAIASSDRRYRDPRYDYDRRHYRRHGYYPNDGHYYRDHYRRHRGYRDCYVRRVWDPYYGRRVAVRYCD